MKFVSFWQNPPGRVTPPYVALALVSLQRVLKGDFVLLGAADMERASWVPARKDWRFGKLDFLGHPDALSIVARSDFIRMAYVYHHGGYWLDADTIALDDPRPMLAAANSGSKLHWLNEALFGARAGNPLLTAAIDRCLANEEQVWGNPGHIRELIDAYPDQVLPVSRDLVDPRYCPEYRFTTCDVMLETALPVHNFLVSPEVKLLKLYNTYFSRSFIGQMSVADFLCSGTLLARIFLHIDPDANRWIAECRRLESAISQ